jgi:hypothetical protein
MEVTIDLNKLSDSLRISLIKELMSLGELKVDSINSVDIARELVECANDDQNYDDCLSMANNPETSTIILDELAECEDYDVLLGVAEHENTSQKTLWDLADDEDIDEDVCRAAIKNLRRKVYKE